MLDQLPPLQRLALAYAPAASRGAFLAVMALDGRLAQIVRSSHEPMLAQLRLAWWREQLSTAPDNRPAGDPLLALLAVWPGPVAPLAGLVDGWEAMIGTPPLDGSAFMVLANARADALASLAPDAKDRESALRMAINWALADVAAKLSDPAERAIVEELVREQDWRQDVLPRKLRPIAVLHTLAARAVEAGHPMGQGTAMDLFVAARVGLLGR